MISKWRLPAAWRPRSLSAAIAILAAVAVSTGALAFVGYRAAGLTGLFGVLALAPILAAVAAPALIELFPSYLRWVDERTLEPWQGRYYAFDDHQIRIAAARGELWFAIPDVHAALAIPLRAHLLRGFNARERTSHPEFGDALSLTGLRRLLGKRTDATTLRFLRWAAHDVHRPWTHRRERDGTTSSHASDF